MRDIITIKAIHFLAFTAIAAFECKPDILQNMI